jgi:hypothetical protein
MTPLDLVEMFVRTYHNKDDFVFRVASSFHVYKDSTRDELLGVIKIKPNVDEVNDRQHEAGGFM